MMSERKLYQIFKEKIKKADPNCFWYKIPDFALGGLRPFDGFLVIQGIPFAIEFKSKDGSLTKYQSYQLTDFVNAGGESLIFWQGKETLDEFIQKILNKIHEHKYTLPNRIECPHCGVTKLPHKPKCYSQFYK